MSMDVENHSTMNATTYEYRTVAAPADRVALTRDTYAAFGWTTDGAPTTGSPLGRTTLSLKRDRHIKNRSMINELQRKAESALDEIDRLERSKTQKAMIVALAIGLVGTAFLAGSVFSYLAALWIPFVLLGALGLAGWAAPYIMYRRIESSQSRRVAPLIDQRYDTIYDASEQAQRLAVQQ